ncbi:MAG: SBBP repeat-containing protein, partial [Bryobacteraceae bacterium]
LAYATYLGGAGIDSANAVAVDAAFRIYVAGFTASEAFPTTPGAPQISGRSGWDAIVSVLDPSKSATQSMLFSTYFGGTSTDVATGIAVDATGKVYITGSTFSTDYPISDRAYQSNQRGQGDAFVTKFDPALSGFASILYSTYIGGGGYDVASRIVVAPSGDVWVAGVTLSADFPVTSDAAQSRNAGQGDAFVARLNLNLESARQITYATYMGGSGTEMTYGLAVDSVGRAYISGYTLSPDLPVKNSPLQSAYGGGGSDAFIAAIDPRVSGDAGLVYATYIGGAGTDIAFRVVVDRAGDVSVGGFTRSHTLPLSGNRIQGAYDGFSAAFLTKLKID